MIRLSVIVPFYNVEQYIEQCIRSLYDQDIPQEEYEVICVDDCSPDGSRTIVERLQMEYPTLRLICHEQNKRLGGARNTGLKAAKGKYVWFVDSDDYVVSNCFNDLLQVAEENLLDILHFEYLEDRNGKITRYFPKQDDSDVLNGADLFFRGEGNWHIHYVVAWQKIYRRVFLIGNQIYFQEHVMFEDNEYAFKAFANAKRAKHVNITAYIYRENSTSVTREVYQAQHLIWLLDTSISISGLIRRLEQKDIRFAEAARKYVRDTVYKVNWYVRKLPAAEQRKVRSYFHIGRYMRLYPQLTHRMRVELLKTIYVQR